jgi:hypothetical protein
MNVELWKWKFDDEIAYFMQPEKAGFERKVFFWGKMFCWESFVVDSLETCWFS